MRAAFPAGPLTHSLVCSQIVAHAKSATSKNLRGLLASLPFYFLPQLCSCGQPAGGQAESSLLQPGCPGTAPAPQTHAPVGFDFKDGLKGDEKGLSFHQPIPLSLQPSPAWFPAPVGPNPITPPITTPNTRSEDRPCPGSSHAPAEMSSQARRCSSISPMENNQKQEGDAPCGSPSSSAGSPLPPETPAPPSPYLAAARTESSREGRDGEGEVDSFGFSQLVKARGEPAAPPPAPPLLSPARGRIQPRGESSSPPAAPAMALTAPDWPI